MSVAATYIRHLIFRKYAKMKLHTEVPTAVKYIHFIKTLEVLILQTEQLSKEKKHKTPKEPSKTF